LRLPWNLKPGIRTSSATRASPHLTPLGRLLRRQLLTHFRIGGSLDFLEPGDALLTGKGGVAAQGRDFVLVRFEEGCEFGGLVVGQAQRLFDHLRGGRCAMGARGCVPSRARCEGVGCSG
jgi:hypothetical protein